MVSHNPGDIERFCSRAILLEEGKIVQEGSGQEIAHAYVQSLTSEKGMAISKQGLGKRSLQ
jgi:ABC-type polysaccharide/polyol phosphate transport system ATPase subunit